MIATNIIAIAVLSLCIYSTNAQEAGLPSVTAALEEKLKNYDKRMNPNLGISPVQINVSMYIMDISSVNENTMDFTITCYLRHLWKDSRLAGINVTGWNGQVTHNAEITARMWTPDTFFPKDKELILHESTHPNSMLRITPEGDILHSVRITTRTACSMNLRYFPMDTQTCDLELESYGHKASEIRYKWKADVGIVGELQLMRYKLIGYRNKPEIFEALSSGNYSRLGVEFFFKRDTGYYIMNLYLPSALFVLLCCLSYWLGPHCMQPRGLLTLTCVLGLTILIAGNDDALPPVSYVRAIDVYLITCFFFVLAALAQFVVVHHMRPRSSQHYDDLEKTANRNEDQQLSSFQLDASLLKIMESHASKVDKYAKFVVPVTFFLFNFLYWIIYLNVGGIEGEYTKYSMTD